MTEHRDTDLGLKDTTEHFANNRLAALAKSKGPG
jgi:hypothetical protein